MFQFQDGSIKWPISRYSNERASMFQFQDGSIKWEQKVEGN